MAAPAARDDLHGLRETLDFSIRLSCFVMVPASLGIFLLRYEIVRLFFERGGFAESDTAGTAWALGFYTVGLTAFAGVKIVAQAFYSLGDTRTPVRVGVGTMLLNIVLNLLFMGPLAHGGLALATSCSATVNFLGLFLLARRRLRRVGGEALFASLVRISVASLGMVPVVLFLRSIWWAGLGLWGDLFWLGGTIAAAVLVYAALSALLRGEEGPALFSLLTRRRRELR
jgi:putative peptidoglycan lipid II flippase